MIFPRCGTLFTSEVLDNSDSALTRQSRGDQDVVLAVFGQNRPRAGVVDVHEQAIVLAKLPVGHGG